MGDSATFRQHVGVPLLGGIMNTNKRQSFPWRPLAAALSIMFFATGVSLAADVKVTLSGDQEVPAVSTKATGTGTIVVNADKTVSGKVTTTGIKATAAHIHEAPSGKAGPVVISLTMDGDDTWSVAAGAKLNDAQYKAFEAGNLYVNVHSAEHKDGEIRGQLKP